MRVAGLAAPLLICESVFWFLDQQNELDYFWLLLPFFGGVVIRIAASSLGSEDWRFLLR